MIENKFSLVVYDSDWLISKAVRPNVWLASKIIFRTLNSGIFNEFGPLVSWTSGFQILLIQKQTLVQKVWGSNAIKYKWNEHISSRGLEPTLGPQKLLSF